MYSLLFIKTNRTLPECKFKKLNKMMHLHTLFLTKKGLV